MPMLSVRGRCAKRTAAAKVSPPKSSTKLIGTMPPAIIKSIIAHSSRGGLAAFGRHNEGARGS